MVFFDSFWLSNEELSCIWLAAHFKSKLKKNEITETSIEKACNALSDAGKFNQNIPLRHYGQCLVGLAYIHDKQCEYLYNDCNEVFTRIKYNIRNNQRKQQGKTVLDDTANECKDLTMNVHQNQEGNRLHALDVDFDMDEDFDRVMQDQSMEISDEDESLKKKRKTTLDPEQLLLDEKMSSIRGSRRRTALLDDPMADLSFGDSHNIDIELNWSSEDETNDSDAKKSLLEIDESSGGGPDSVERTRRETTVVQEQQIQDDISTNLIIDDLKKEESTKAGANDVLPLEEENNLDLLNDEEESNGMRLDIGEPSALKETPDRDGGKRKRSAESPESTTPDDFDLREEKRKKKVVKERFGRDNGHFLPENEQYVDFENSIDRRDICHEARDLLQHWRGDPLVTSNQPVETLWHSRQSDHLGEENKDGNDFYRNFMKKVSAPLVNEKSSRKDVPEEHDFDEVRREADEKSVEMEAPEIDVDLEMEPIHGIEVNGDDESVLGLLLDEAREAEKEEDEDTEMDEAREVEVEIAERRRDGIRDWNKRTAKAFQYLKKVFKSDRNKRNGHKISFDYLVSKSKKRENVAGIFYELLILKNADLIELEQPVGYQDITIVKTKEFDKYI